MATLRQVLDDALLLLQNPGFKTPGAVRKSIYQHSKGKEDAEIRRIMYEGGLGNSEEAKQKAKITHKQKVESGEWKEICERAAQTRTKWYKDPDNYEKFKKAIKNRRRQSSGSKP